MKRMFKAAGRRLTCILPVWLAIAPAGAQTTDTDVLDVIVVTATRMETSVRNVPRSISVVNKDRIQNGTQQLALDEALAGVPGLYMQNRYNFAQDLRISLRGFGARSSFGIRGVKIIVDGIPETLLDGLGGGVGIDLGSASSIEVLRGPASAQTVRADDPWCERNNSWHSDYDETYGEVREVPLAPRQSLDVNAGENGGISVEAWDRNEVQLLARVEAKGDSRAEARRLDEDVEIETDTDAKQAALRASPP